MLHSRVFFDWFHLSAGVTAKAGEEGTEVEYLLGPSLGFGIFGTRLFLTFGAYGGWQRSLEGGLYLNAPVPESLAELPMRRTFCWKPGFAITWRP
jgi:hypothetical protein